MPVLQNLLVKILDISESCPQNSFNPSISIINGELLMTSKVFALCNVKTYISKLDGNLNPIQWNEIKFHKDVFGCPPEDIRVVSRAGKPFFIGSRANHTDFSKYISFGTAVYKADLDSLEAFPFLFFKDLGDFSNKNWTTISNNEDDTFNFIVSHPDSIRGGSNLIPYEDGYISINHKTYIPNPSDKRYRYYSNVFIKYNASLNIEKISNDFLFESSDVEFATGLVYYKDNFIVSYGVDDSKSRLAFLKKEDIENLWRH
jgi:hypothetical protein